MICHGLKVDITIADIKDSYIDGSMGAAEKADGGIGQRNSKTRHK